MPPPRYRPAMEATHLSLLVPCLRTCNRRSSRAFKSRRRKPAPMWSSGEVLLLPLTSGFTLAQHQQTSLHADRLGVPLDCTCRQYRVGAHPAARLLGADQPMLASSLEIDGVLTRERDHNRLSRESQSRQPRWDVDSDDSDHSSNPYAISPSRWPAQFVLLAYEPLGRQRPRPHGNRASRGGP